MGYVSSLEGICENDWKTNVLQIIDQIYWYFLCLGIFIQSTVQMMFSMKSIYGTDPRRVLPMLLMSPSIIFHPYSSSKWAVATKNSSIHCHSKTRGWWWDQAFNKYDASKNSLKREAFHPSVGFSNRSTHLASLWCFGFSITRRLSCSTEIHVTPPNNRLNHFYRFRFCIF